MAEIETLMHARRQLVEGTEIFDVPSLDKVLLKHENN
jgi:hypothetical protein